MGKKTDGAKAPKVPQVYVVASPQAITTKRGILAPGEVIEAKDVLNEGTFERLIKSGTVVKDEP